MTTLLEVCQEANELMLGGMREQISQLNGSISATQSNIVLDSGLEGMSRGDVLEVDTEQMYVLTWTPPGSAIVLRGYGSTKIEHDDNAPVTINPIVPMTSWRRHINNELRSLSSPAAGLYRIETSEVTYNASTVGFNLAGVEDIDGVLAVYALQPGGHGDWVDLRRTDWALQSVMATGDFPSSYALRLTGRQPYPGQRVRVLYRAPFGLLNEFTDIVESAAGLPSTAVDLLALGAVIRAVEGSEVARNKLETNPSRKLDSVPNGAIAASLAGFRNRYDERRAEERGRLTRRYGL